MSNFKKILQNILSATFFNKIINQPFLVIFHLNTLEIKVKFQIFLQRTQVIALTHTFSPYTVILHDLEIFTCKQEPLDSLTVITEMRAWPWENARPSTKMSAKQRRKCGQAAN